MNKGKVKNIWASLLLLSSVYSFAPFNPCQAQSKSTVVYANKEIKTGTRIPASSAEEKQVDRKQIPPDCNLRANNVVGRIARYGIVPGQLIGKRDLVPTNSKYVVIRLSPPYMSELSKMASQKNVSTETLIRKWIDENLKSGPKKK